MGSFAAHIPPADMYQSKSFARSRTADARLQPGTRAAFRRLVNRGWTEAARTRHPAAAIDSFWDVARNVWPRDAKLRDAKLRDAGLRITHILCSPDLAARTNASDHAAAWVTLPCAGKPERRRVRPQRRVAEP